MAYKKGKEDDAFKEIEMADTSSMDFGYNKNIFSHEAIVMAQYIATIKALSAEMHPGHWGTETDEKGNLKTVYFPDTRKVAISHINTLKNIMASDLKSCTDIKKNIDALYKKIEDKIESIEKERGDKQISDLMNYGINSLKNDPKIIDEESMEYQRIIEYSLIIAREIFEELEACGHKLKYFKKQMVEA